MSFGALATDWTTDGPVGVAFLVLLAAVATVYLLATVIGTRRDRRSRRWPLARSCCFIGGLAVLIADLYSGIGAQADSRLAAHMVEHMIMWLVVAPLLAAGAPVRLALFALGRGPRRALVRCLHSRAARALTSPLGSVGLFSAVLLGTHVPTVYGLALANDYFHEAEHATYLLAALLLWAPLLGVDPLPGRLDARGRFACMGACMLPMIAIGVWLLSGSQVLYAHYAAALGASALADQRLAGAIMLAASVPAFAVVALIRAPVAGRDRPGAAHASIAAR